MVDRCCEQFGPSQLSADQQLIQWDNFAVRWEGNLPFADDAAYVFSSFADDGSRLTVDGRVIIDKWDHCCVSFSSQPIALAGSTSVRYEMHELGGSGKMAILSRCVALPAPR